MDSPWCPVVLPEFGTPPAPIQNLADHMPFSAWLSAPPRATENHRSPSGCRSSRWAVRGARIPAHSGANSGAGIQTGRSEVAGGRLGRVTDAYRYRRALLREHAQRAARFSWERRLSTSATVQAFATSFMRLAPRASGSSLTVSVCALERRTPTGVVLARRHGRRCVLGFLGPWLPLEGRPGAALPSPCARRVSAGYPFDRCQTVRAVDCTFCAGTTATGGVSAVEILPFAQMTQLRLPCRRQVTEPSEASATRPRLCLVRVA
jgi:hypothetical protein